MRKIKIQLSCPVDFVDHTFMSGDPIHQPNDGLFKFAFTEKETAIQSLQKYFPKGLSKHVQWQELELQPADFVDERYKRSSSDLLYRVPIAGKDSFIYCLFEHWSTQDHWVALRLLKYQVRIWEQFLQQNPGTQMLPPIVPVVLAQHNKEWKVPKQFIELLDIPNELEEAVQDFIPNFTYRLIELIKMPYEKIEGTPTGILSLRVLRAASLKELMNDMVWDEEMFEQIPDKMIAAILNYIQNSLSKVDDQPFQGKIKALKSNRLRKIAMTLTEKYIEDGRAEGILVGQIQGYQRLLGQNETSAEKLLNLPKENLQALHDKLETEIQQKLRG